MKNWSGETVSIKEGVKSPRKGGRSCRRQRMVLMEVILDVYRRAQTVMLSSGIRKVYVCFVGSPLKRLCTEIFTLEVDRRILRREMRVQYVNLQR